MDGKIWLSNLCWTVSQFSFFPCFCVVFDVLQWKLVDIRRKKPEGMMEGANSIGQFVIWDDPE